MLVKQMTKQEAKDLLGHCLAEGTVRFGSHFRNALADDDLTYFEAEHVLKTGHIYDAPEQDIKTGEWKYRIEGREPGGKKLKVVFSFKTVNSAFLITVWVLERG